MAPGLHSPSSSAMREGLSISLPADLTDELDQATAAEGISRSDLVRDGLRAYIMARRFRALGPPWFRTPRPRGSSPMTTSSAWCREAGRQISCAGDCHRGRKPAADGEGRARRASASGRSCLPRSRRRLDSGHGPRWCLYLARHRRQGSPRHRGARRLQDPCPSGVLAL